MTPSMIRPLAEANRPLWMDIDFGALEHNLGVVRRLAGRRRLIASVKANAYGRGAVAITRELARLGVDTLWTGNIDEALAIHAAGIDARTLLFGGHVPGDIPLRSASSSTWWTTRSRGPARPTNSILRDTINGSTSLRAGANTSKCSSIR